MSKRIETMMAATGIVGILMVTGLTGKAQNRAIRVPKWITDTIFKLPEIIREGNWIDSATNHQRHLTVLAFPEDLNGTNCWHVEVREDNGISYITYFNFYAWSRTRVIKYIDIENHDKAISLAAWRKMKPRWHER